MYVCRLESETRVKVSQREESHVSHPVCIFTSLVTLASRIWRRLTLSCSGFWSFHQQVYCRSPAEKQVTLLSLKRLCCVVCCVWSRHVTRILSFHLPRHGVGCCCSDREQNLRFIIFGPCCFKHLKWPNISYYTNKTCTNSIVTTGALLVLAHAVIITGL